MRYILTIAIVAGLGATGIAAASDFAPSRTAGTERAIPAAEMKAKIANLGYDLRRMKADDGQYEVQIVDRESGVGVKAKFDEESGELLAAMLAKDDSDERDHRGESEHDKARYRHAYDENTNIRTRGH